LIANTGWDVVVAGGGPAGAMTAWHLAKAGLKVAVLDASRFPRDKACGGGVQARTEPWIPFEWKSVVKSSIQRADFTYRLARRFSREYPEPLVHCVRRTEFDAHLLNAARDAGAHIFEGVRVNRVAAHSDHAAVSTSQGDMAARYVVGADGANTVVGKALNSRDAFFWQAAIYLELPFAPAAGSRLTHDALRIDWASLPSGYAWIFPKRDIVNIGAGCPVALAKALRRYLRSFLLAEDLFDAQSVEQLKPVGHLLPTLTHRTVPAADRLFLVGDAAGLVEPLTGEGISYACHSASLAARSIVANFDSSHEACHSYAKGLHREIGVDLALARRILSFGVSFPRLFYWAFRHSDEVWITFCKVLRGETTFEQLRNRILGPFKVLGSSIDALVAHAERKRMSVQTSPGFQPGG
jgi:geranylgeranyl reductase family protein